MMRTDSIKTDNLQSLFGVSDAAPAVVSGGGVSSKSGDWATLSAAGGQMAQAAGDSSVREDKVAQVRAALASGTLLIPASAVAASTVNAMLTSAG